MFVGMNAKIEMLMKRVTTLERKLKKQNQEIEFIKKQYNTLSEVLDKQRDVIKDNVIKDDKHHKEADNKDDTTVYEEVQSPPKELDCELGFSSSVPEENTSWWWS